MKRSFQSMIAAVPVAASLFSFSMSAAAQDQALRATYESSATMPSTVEGIRTFPAPPSGFNPLAASDMALATYGLPPHPDRGVDPDGYAKWARAMTHATKRWDGELKATKIYHQPMKPAKATSIAAATAAATVSNAASVGNSSNWSGVVNTNTLKKYNPSTSYYYIVSEFNVPVAQQAACDGGWDYASSWNGIDGFNSGDVLQGGVEYDAYCNGGTHSTFYSAWIEWYPFSETRVFSVNPGDDMFVETWDTSATQGYVFLEDMTTNTSAVYSLTPPSGTSLVGNSAEYIVERPGVNGGLATLTYYIDDFWALNDDVTFKGIVNVPGATGPSTWLLNMLDNNGNVVSSPTVEGKYGIFFQYR
jgi:hypothetical protein